MILSEQELLRRQKRQELIGMGIDPYPAAAFLVSHYSSQILAEYKPELNNFQEVSLAGRLMGFRIMGNASFAELQDANGRIQTRKKWLCMGGPWKRQDWKLKGSN